MAHGRQAPLRLEWDARTRRLIEPGAVYGRMIRLRRQGGGSAVLCCYEKAGRCWTRTSRDGGKSWPPPVPAASYAHGAAANPEAVELRDGRILLFFNERPRPAPGAKSGEAPRFGINLAVSDDGGATWRQPRRAPVFQAGAEARVGCWEPAALELPSGELLLFFANEAPFPASDEQEVSLCRSRDGGATWTEPRRVIFRPGHRDGMPVPLLLRGRDGRPRGDLAVAIEDNGLPTSPLLQPAVVTGGVREWLEGPSAAGNSPRRTAAVVPALPRGVYAGAPYLAQLPTGETLLSCQSTEGVAGGGDPLRRARMAVYVGDEDARGFAGRTAPFGDGGDAGGAAELWNSLFVRDADTVTALSSTVIGGVQGLWAVDARVHRSALRG